VYAVVGTVLGLLVRGRGRAKDVERLVLRHEVAVAGQAGRSCAVGVEGSTAVGGAVASAATGCVAGSAGQPGDCEQQGRQLGDGRAGNDAAQRRGRRRPAPGRFRDRRLPGSVMTSPLSARRGESDDGMGRPTRRLVLDQSMIMAGLDNVVNDRVMQGYFAGDPFSWAAKLYLSSEMMMINWTSRPTVRCARPRCACGRSPAAACASLVSTA
jgi:hypothetical protein